MTRQPTHLASTQPPSLAAQRHALIAVLALAGLFVWVFWRFVSIQVRWAIEAQADWGHTLIIPFICVYFLYLKREEILAQPFKTAWFGLAPMVFGIAWYMFCWVGPETIRHHNLQAFGAWLTLVGMTLLFFGWRPMRWMWFPLLYLLVFGQTISERILNEVTYRLQDITAVGAAFVLNVFVDVERAGNQINIHFNGVTHPLNIAEACSGMRMLMAFLALGTAMAYTGLPYLWQRVVLVLMGFPTAVFVNILRVVTLGVLSLLDSGFAAGEFHKFIGLVWLVPAFFIFLGIMWIVQHLVVESPEGAPAAKATPRKDAAPGEAARDARIQPPAGVPAGSEAPP